MKKKALFTDLLKDEELTKDSYLFNIEHSRVSESCLFLKFEVFNYQEKSVFKLKVQIDLTEELKNIPMGKSINKVGLFTLESKNFFQILKDGIENSVSEGKIPFLHGFLG